ncbi:exodeoxyribonuclease VII large subunit [Nitrincola schmidtii]|uniref:exodeoxyribonuclease VII large subunit n=1 Tax=Nitrincola schmidtii TaxID=1730894 RepID=UPI00124ED303|nr:exodeoxyribonuclease VII large subunit [Nitrincola schmidtii]
MNRSSFTASSAALSVSQLNREAKRLLEASFSLIRVEGELTNFARPASGHWYFTLKDPQAQVRCAMFRNRSQLLSFRPKEGDQVIVTAKVSLFEGRGDFQLICEQMMPSGEGQLQKAFEQVKQELSQRGFFDPARKRPLPKHPRRIGVITSATGAAIHDILHVLQRRFPNLPVNLYPSAVQGAEAADQLVAALALANRHAECDVLIIGRGGGSLEDLWPFNEVRVAEAILRSAIPVVSAVGHETDTTISDLVADYRAPTPSAAAEVLSPDQQALFDRLMQHQRSLIRQISRHLQQAQQGLDLQQLRLKHPGERLTQQAQQLTQIESTLIRLQQQQLIHAWKSVSQTEQRLDRQTPKFTQQALRLSQLRVQLKQRMESQMTSHRYVLQQTARRLNSISPLATLDRGFSLLMDHQGQVIQSVTQATTGDILQAKLKDGVLNCQVIADTFKETNPQH